MKNSLIPWASALGLLLIAPVRADTIHIAHCLEQCPEVSSSNNELVVRHLYAASIDAASGLAEWVAYKVLPDSVGVASLLPRYWHSDALLDTAVSDEALENDGPRLLQPDLSNAQDREYRVGEVLINPEDRGRLAPMSSFAGTPYWEELNNLSNMAPLPPDLRLGSWARLEMAINELAASSGELYVVSGPIAASREAWFKLVAGDDGVAAFLFADSLPIHASYCEQASSLAEIQALAGLTLLPTYQGGASDAILTKLGCTQ